MSRRNDDNSKPEHRSSDEVAVNSAYRQKLTVHRRDRNTCINCRERFDDQSHLDADHVVARGDGGARTVRNQATMCRRCHDAKHGDREHAPTIRWRSTGDMPEKDYEWYKRFWSDLLPAVTEAAVGYRIKPVTNLSSETEYVGQHIPVGDVTRLCQLLADCNDVRFAGYSADRYM
jgi:hypothetical protein